MLSELWKDIFFGFSSLDPSNFAVLSYYMHWENFEWNEAHRGIKLS